MLIVKVRSKVKYFDKTDVSETRGAIEYTITIECKDIKYRFKTTENSTSLQNSVL